MKKLFALLAMAAISSSAFAQASFPNPTKRALPDVPGVDVREVTVNILQVQQCRPATAEDIAGGKAVALPPGIVDAGFCLGGPLAGGSPVTELKAFPACRFIGGVLCLDPGPAGNFESFLSGCPAGTTPVIQGVKLRKIEPRIPKCPDVYPGIDFTQTGLSGIRTFWALKYTPCETIFRLDLEIGCVGRDAAGRERVVQVHVNRFNFKVVIRPDTFRWVVEALHCQPLGLCEVPCITDEGLFQRLLEQADAIAAQARGAAGGDQASLRALNDTLDRTEALIVRFCLFTTQVWGVRDKTGVLVPCIIWEQKGAAPGFIPGNKTIGQFGFGIVDTIEHPCCCKLIADIFWLKDQLIGRDP